MTVATPLRIEGEMTIYRASELAQALQDALAALPAGEALQVDLSAVTEMDCAGVQLLLASGRSASAAGRALRLVARSPAIDEVFDTLHLRTQFDDACAPA